MKTTLRNLFVFVAGVFVGSLVNGLIINFSGAIIPPPAGFDLTTSEGLKAATLVMEPKHFIMPFLAHAIGTFIGAFLVTIFSKGRRFFRALMVGFLFFTGGVIMIFILPSPLWFDALDLGLAYIPMAWLGYKMTYRISE